MQGSERPSLFKWKRLWCGYHWCQLRSRSVRRPEQGTCSYSLVFAPRETRPCQGETAPQKPSCSPTNPTWAVSGFTCWSSSLTSVNFLLAFKHPAGEEETLLKPSLVCSDFNSFLAAFTQRQERHGWSGIDQAASRPGCWELSWEPCKHLPPLQDFIAHISHRLYLSKKEDSRQKHLQDVLHGSGHFRRYEV